MTLVDAVVVFLNIGLRVWKLGFRIDKFREIENAYRPQSRLNYLEAGVETARLFELSR